MKKIMISVTLAALALAAIASAQDVRFNFDTGANFANFKTYKWVEIPGGVKLDDLISRQLTSALQAGLATKGLSKVDGDAAVVGLALGLRRAHHGRTATNSASSATMSLRRKSLGVYTRATPAASISGRSASGMIPPTTTGASTPLARST